MAGRSVVTLSNGSGRHPQSQTFVAHPTRASPLKAESVAEVIAIDHSMWTPTLSIMGVSRDYMTGAADLLDVGGVSEVQSRAGLVDAWQTLGQAWGHVVVGYPAAAEIREASTSDQALESELIWMES